jgi:hypothetical protein
VVTNINESLNCAFEICGILYLNTYFKNIWSKSSHSQHNTPVNKRNLRFFKSHEINLPRYLPATARLPFLKYPSFILSDRNRVRKISTFISEQWYNVNMQMLTIVALVNSLH